MLSTASDSAPERRQSAGGRGKKGTKRKPDATKSNTRSSLTFLSSLLPASKILLYKNKKILKKSGCESVATFRMSARVLTGERENGKDKTHTHIHTYNHIHTHFSRLWFAL